VLFRSNYLCWREIKLIFLDKPNKGPLCNRALDAAQCGNIDYEAISSFYVSENDYKKSFCSFYFPSWVEFNRITEPPLCQQKIMICPKCAELGKHLTIHQIKMFGLCPLHNVKLQDTCLSCSKPIGFFQIDSGNRGKGTFNAFKCMYCEHENLNFNNHESKHQELFQNNLRRFLKSYEVWLTDINQTYLQYDWINIYGNLNIALNLSSPPKQVVKAHQDNLYFIQSEIDFKLPLTSEKPLDCASFKQKSIFDKFFNELLLFSQDQLTNIEKRFHISRNQCSTVHFLTPSTNIFWGGNYTIWAHAYSEVCHVVNYRYQRAHLLSEFLDTHFWLIGMWYAHFAEPLLKYFKILDENQMKLLILLSKIWIRKFVVQLFINEVYRLCKGLLGIEQEQDPGSRLIERVGENYPLFSLVVAYQMGSEKNKMKIWRRGPRITDLAYLQKNGFNGFTPNMQQRFLNYRKLHSVFKIAEKPLKKHEYLEVTSEKTIIKI
jgi:hypothetical protein